MIGYCGLLYFSNIVTEVVTSYCTNFFAIFSIGFACWGERRYRLFVTMDEDFVITSRWIRVRVLDQLYCFSFDIVSDTCVFAHCYRDTHSSLMVCFIRILWNCQKNKKLTPSASCCFCFDDKTDVFGGELVCLG
jgi:hypothetical protein